MFYLKLGSTFDDFESENATPIIRFEAPVRKNFQFWKEELGTRPITEFYIPLSDASGNFVWKRIKLEKPDSRPDAFKMYDFEQDGIFYKVQSFQIIVVKQNQLPELSEEQELPVKNSLNAELSNSGMLQVKRILKYLSASMKIYQSGPSFYAPYTSLCQSSGFGKTRGAIDCGFRLATIYGVFRKSGETNFPRQSKWVSSFYQYINEAPHDDFPINPTDPQVLSSGLVQDYKVGRVLLLLETMLLSYRDLFLELAGNNLSRIFLALNRNDLGQVNISDGDGDGFARIYSDLINAFKNGGDVLSRYNVLFEANWQSILSNERTNVASNLGIRGPSNIRNDILAISNSFISISKAVCASKERCGEGSILSTNDAYPFLIILDEASILVDVDSPARLNTISALRRAFHWFPPAAGTSILLVNIGTNSDISTFHAAISSDSLRFVGREDLLPPFILTGNWDIFSDELDIENLDINFNMIQNRCTYFLLLSFGRALWSSLSVNYVQGLASTKLINGNPPSFMLEPHIASWCIRTGFSVNSSHIMAKKLLKSYMATLCAVNNDASSLYVGYSSEPVLAMASRELINRPNSRQRHFESLLEFIERVPVDRGRIAEYVFAEMLQEAVDTAQVIDTFVNQIVGGNEFVRKIYRTREYVLEPAVVENPDLPPPRNEILPIHHSINSIYRIVSVRSFLTSLLGATEFNAMLPHLPESILGGTINASQFITLRRNFPYERAFGEELGCSLAQTELKDASLDFRKKCNIIDRALLKMGILRQVAFMMPPLYYGFDMIIPVIMNQSGRTVFTFIGIQSKAGKSNVTEVMMKMQGQLHYVPCPRESHDLDIPDIVCQYCTDFNETNEIFNNQLTIVTSSSIPYSFGDSENDDTTSKVHYFSSKSSRASISTCRTKLFPNYVLPMNSNNRKVSLINPPTKKVNRVSIRHLPNYFMTIPINESSSLMLGKMSWYGVEQVQTCIFIRGLNDFRNLMGDPLLELADKIINYEHEPFSRADFIQFPSVVDGMVNTAFASYPNCDKLLRKCRGFDKVPDPVDDYVHINIESVAQTRIRYARPHRTRLTNT